MGMAQGSKKGRMMRNFVHSTVFGLGLALAMPAHAQQASDQTLADIRQELTNEQQNAGRNKLQKSPLHKLRHRLDISGHSRNENTRLVLIKEPE